MIYEQLHQDISELDRLEKGRSMKFTHENAATGSRGDVFFESPDFRLKIVCESGWAYIELSPLCEDRWLEIAPILKYLGRELVSANYRYGLAPLEVQLDEINAMYDMIAKALKDARTISAIEAVARQSLDALVSRLREK